MLIGPHLAGSAEVWLIVREHVESTPHLRLFAKSLAAQVQALRAQLAGERLRVGGTAKRAAGAVRGGQLLGAEVAMLARGRFW
jgi:hypothetical protein